MTDKRLASIMAANIAAGELFATYRYLGGHHPARPCLGDGREACLDHDNQCQGAGELFVTCRNVSKVGTILSGSVSRAQDLGYKTIPTFFVRKGLQISDDEHVLVWSVVCGRESIRPHQAGMQMVYQELIPTGAEDVKMWCMTWEEWTTEPDDLPPHPAQ